MKLESIGFVDQNGEAVHAHGGQILFHEGFYYFIGENRTGRNKVSCYRSVNLRDWEFRSHLLTVDSQSVPHPQMTTDLRLEVDGRKAKLGVGCNIERPKVIFNQVTKQFVMWMHWELPDDYQEARCAVAVCDTIDRDYTYLGSFNPIGYMSRDCTVFQDEDGTAYFISAARDNYDLHIYRLSRDYLTIDRLVRKLWPGQHREAPTVFKRNGTYYMLTSACTGWTPNQGSFAYTRDLEGDWSDRYDFGDETTYGSQPTWVLPSIDPTSCQTEYIYIGDRWGGAEGYFQSEYVLLPILFKGDTHICINKDVKLF